MKNAYAMNQFEFIEQKLQNCGLVRNQVSPSHSTFSHWANFKFRTWSNLTSSKVSEGSSVDPVGIATQPHGQARARMSPFVEQKD